MNRIISVRKFTLPYDLKNCAVCAREIGDDPFAFIFKACEYYTCETCGGNLVTILEVDRLEEPGELKVMKSEEVKE